MLGVSTFELPVKVNINYLTQVLVRGYSVIWLTMREDTHWIKGKKDSLDVLTSFMLRDAIIIEYYLHQAPRNIPP